MLEQKTNVPNAQAEITAKLLEFRDICTKNGYQLICGVIPEKLVEFKRAGNSAQALTAMSINGVQFGCLVVQFVEEFATANKIKPSFLAKLIFEYLEETETTADEP